MTLEEVIVHLEGLREGLDLPDMAEYEAALNIAIEAVKAYQSARTGNTIMKWDLLPGETE